MTTSTNKKTVYIVWDESGSEVVGERYIGGGEFARDTRAVTITRRARWSSDTSPASIEKARAYVRDNMAAHQLNPRVEILSD